MSGPNNLELFQNVSRETFSKLQTYHDLILKWQKAVNLVSQNTLSEIWTRHIYDSAQLHDHIKNKNAKIFDLGSGAGLPGIVISILGCADVTLIESDSKKSAFLTEAIRLLGLNASVLNTRIESIAEKKCDIVTARALAPLDKLLKWSYGLLGEDGCCVFLKGENARTEINDARKLWEFEAREIPSKSATTGCILIIKQIAPR